MDLRRAKQVIYGAFYLIVAAGIVAAAYFLFFYHPATCTDGIQNQGEAGVDCGGPCATVCAPTSTRAIGVLAAQVIPVAPQLSSLPFRYTLFAQVANTANGFAAPSFDYQFDLYSASGTLVQSVPGQSFLYSGEVKYLVAPNVTTDVPVDHAALTVAPPQWVPASAMGIIPQFSLQNLGPGPSTSSTVSVEGSLKDGDLSSFANILVVALFYDRYNAVAGASQTVVDQIAPGETVPFSVLYPASATIDLSRTRFFAYALRG